MQTQSPQDNSIFERSAEDVDQTKHMSKERQREILINMRNLQQLHRTTKNRLDSLDEKGEVKYMGFVNLAIMFLYATSMLSGRWNPNAAHLISLAINSLAVLLTLYSVPKNTSISIKETMLETKLDSVSGEIDLHQAMIDTTKLLKTTSFRDEENRDLIIRNEMNEEKLEPLLIELKEFEKVRMTHEAIVAFLPKIVEEISHDVSLSDEDVQLISGLVTEGVEQMNNFDSRRAIREAMKIEIDDSLRRELDAELPESVKGLLDSTYMDEGLELKIEEIVKKYSIETLDLYSKRTALEIHKSFKQRNG